MPIIDGRIIEFDDSDNLLSACLKAGIYIPHICYHPSIPTCEAGGGCGLCKVIVDNNPEPINACQIRAASVSNVITKSDELTEHRQKNLARILATHPHACLTCSDAEGCTRTSCTQNVSPPERCCSLFGNCELQKVAAYIGIPADTPRYIPAGLPEVKDEPLYDFEYNLCIACGRCQRICRDVKMVDVFTYSEQYGRPVAIPRRRNLKESGCIFCGACVEVCPTGAMMDKPWEQPNREKSIVPCRAACPAEIDVPLYIRLVGEGRYGEAISVIREKAPIPGILGRVCYSPCETGCRRKIWDEPVAIRSLKRFAADNDDGHWKKHLLRRSESGRRIGVVGAGPAGLSASYYLRVLGHGVDLYDAMEKPGGMLRYGIPRYRLPENILDSEIDEILDLGVNFHPGRRIETPEELSGYDAIFWSTGASLEAGLPRGICEENTVKSGLEFLKAINSGEKQDLRGDIAVIGGGNVATDVARSARRSGAWSVTIMYRRARNEMPAYESEINEALAEGVLFRFLLAPYRIARSGERIKVIAQKMKPGELDNSGRRTPIPIEGDIEEFKFDHVFSAIGQKIEKLSAIDFSLSGGFAVNSDYSTSIKGVFAGGDNVTGAASVVEAVEAGRLAAQSIDRYLGGDGLLPSYSIVVDKSFAVESGTAPGLIEAPCLKAEMRSGFDEIEQGFSENMAVAQALRCSRCDLRLSIIPPFLPPERYLSFNLDTVESVPPEAGVVQLYDKGKDVVLISGSDNMREALRSRIDEGFMAAYFTFEPYQMYTQRESEMLSRHLQKVGKLPRGNDLGDELF